MAFTDAQIRTDVGNIFSSLSETGANEEVTLTPASGADASTFDVIRAKTLSERELMHAGWASRYQLSVYTLRTDGSTAAVGDLVTMATEGVLKILNISNGPTRGYIRFDLGDRYSGRA